MSRISPDLTLPQSFLKPFPDPKDVFAGNVELASTYLQPLVSVDLSFIDTDLQGWVHVVSPVEPCEGYVGDGTEEYHNYYCRPNWIGFRLDDHNRYEFLADWKYFLAASDDPNIAQDPELKRHYEYRQDSFARHKAAFAQHGRLLAVDNKYLTKEELLADPEEFFTDLETDAEFGNWASDDGFPLEFKTSDENCFVYPLTEDGRRFIYIGGVSGFAYGDRSADFILLFFDPVTRIALLTFDWT